ncbi:MAG TPA: hypothetical protein VLF90_01720 [Patescibacteria group bacterium]|nr:hypothetical protein [Patescibacteria group bacterium]
MKAFIRPLLLLAIIVAMVGFSVALPSTKVLADAKSDVCAGVGLASGTSGCAPAPGGTSVTSLMRSVVNILSLVIGVVAVIMIMIGGFKYITSGGEAASVTSAKNTILYALVGLVIVALAQAIVHFVIQKL